MYCHGTIIHKKLQKNPIEREWEALQKNQPNLPFFWKHTVALAYFHVETWFELNIDRFLLLLTKTLSFFIIFIIFKVFKLLPFKEGVELSFPPKSGWMVSLLEWQKQKFIWALQTCNFWWKHKHTRRLSCKVSLYSDNPSTPSYCMPLQVRGTLPNCPNYSNVKCVFSKVS